MATEDFDPLTTAGAGGEVGPSVGEEDEVEGSGEWEVEVGDVVEVGSDSVKE